MTGQTYLLFAYIISIALLWGYAGSLWLGWRSLRRRSHGITDVCSKERT